MIRGRQFLILLLQLALVLAVVHSFEIEGRRQLPAVMLLAAAGFAVHFWLPAKLRPWLFVTLSLGSLPLVLSWQDSLLVFALGMAMIGVCWLPVSYGLRVVALLLIAGNLAWWRSGSEQLFWPVLGAMFMFRLIVYVFETRHEQRQPLAQTLAYFFMLPNVCFTLFPVVDYRTFLRTYYDAEEQTIYQTGIDWIVRGLTHLLLYRWIKYYLLPAPHEIDDLPHLALFLAANYALYLRVSGQFHLITGLLHLFGFNLPPTHHWYFLATSFTDIWRRINIYWKDFMQQVFFFPVFFRLRGLGVIPAMLVATAGVFLATWLLHSYQVFWLLDDFPLSANDALLWLCVGALVAINGFADLRRARRSSPATPGWSWSIAAINSLKALGMFSAVSIFWGQWTHPELFAGLNLSLAPPLTTAFGWLAGSMLIAVAVGSLLQKLHDKWQRRTAQLPPHFSMALRMLLLSGIVALSQTQFYRDPLPQLAGVASSLKQESDTPMEAAQLVRGYYEEINEASLQSQALLSNGPHRREGPPRYADMIRPTGDMLQNELIPNWKGELEGRLVSVNRWGMRDRDYPKLKPPGVYRVALLGSSVVMGYGVGDDQVFDVILEERLNALQATGKPRLELLNFGTGRSFAIHRRLLLEQKALDFQPDAVYYIAHQDEFTGSPQHLAEIWYKKYKLSDKCLEGIVHGAGIKADTSWGMAQTLLTPHAEEIVSCSYQRIVADCRARGILAVWIYLPMPGIVNAPAQSAPVMRIAQREGFLVEDLSDWAGGFAPKDVKLSELDHHANAMGHVAIAERLMTAIREKPELLPAFAPSK